MKTLDRIGVAVSGLCAIHCALMPLIPAVTVGLTYGMGDQGWHMTLTLATLFFGMWSVIFGYLRHRRYWAMFPMGMALSLGFALMTAHEEFEAVPFAHGAAFAVLGTLVMVAHVLNLKLSHGHIHDSKCSHNHEG